MQTQLEPEIYLLMELSQETQLEADDVQVKQDESHAVHVPVLSS